MNAWLAVIVLYVIVTGIFLHRYLDTGAWKQEEKKYQRQAFWFLFFMIMLWPLTVIFWLILKLAGGKSIE